MPKCDLELLESLTNSQKKYANIFNCRDSCDEDDDE